MPGAAQAVLDRADLITKTHVTTFTFREDIDYNEADKLLNTSKIFSGILTNWEEKEHGQQH